MQILLLSTSERIGGAAVAANRLKSALQKSGVTTHLLVRNMSTNTNPDIVSVNTSFINQKINLLRFLWERLVIFLANGLNRPDLFRVSLANTGTDISRHPLVASADIIHLHWINQGFLSLRDIELLIATGKPVVWTMHDMWPCTGICHHARECEKFRDRCSACFYLGSRREKDLSYKNFLRKKRLYQDADISFVGCSQWLKGKAEKSALLLTSRIFSIPNPLDLNLFYSKDPSSSRSGLGLPAQGKLILFGALNVSDERKGVRYLLEAMEILATENISLVVFGEIKEELQTSISFPVYKMGYLSDEKDIASLYSAVDLFVTSSLDENLPNTIMEAMACGTPCVGFDTGGIPEMIDHKENGYVARYEDAADLADGILWVLENNRSRELSEACRKKVESAYEESIVAAQYIDLYKTLSDKKRIE